jgi:predicted RNase H-like nuclease (RuvC/YqgF family)
MTDEQQQILTSFEKRVRELMFLCSSLKKENEALKKELQQKKETIKKSEETIRQLKAETDHLKLANMLSFTTGDIKEARRKITGLVREIDKCIALINE